MHLYFNLVQSHFCEGSQIQLWQWYRELHNFSIFKSANSVYHNTINWTEFKPILQHKYVTVHIIESKAQLMVRVVWAINASKIKAKLWQKINRLF